MKDMDTLKEQVNSVKTVGKIKTLHYSAMMTEDIKLYTEEEVKKLFLKLFWQQIYPEKTNDWELEDFEHWFNQNKLK